MPNNESVRLLVERIEAGLRKHQPGDSPVKSNILLALRKSITLEMNVSPLPFDSRTDSSEQMTKLIKMALSEGLLRNEADSNESGESRSEDPTEQSASSSYPTVEAFADLRVNSDECDPRVDRAQYMCQDLLDLSFDGLLSAKSEEGKQNEEASEHEEQPIPAVRTELAEVVIQRALSTAILEHRRSSKQEGFKMRAEAPEFYPVETKRQQTSDQQGDAPFAGGTEVHKWVRDEACPEETAQPKVSRGPLSKESNRSMQKTIDLQRACADDKAGRDGKLMTGVKHQYKTHDQLTQS